MMNLKRIDIRRIEYGEFKGHHAGEIAFDNELGEVKVNLSPAQCREMFDVVAAGIIETAQAAAHELTITAIEHQNAIGELAHD